MGKYKIIVNPVAVRGGAKKLLPLIERELRLQKIDYDIAFTEHPWHAAALTQQAIVLGYDVIVSVGGDGTFNEVLNGVMLARQAGLGGAALAVLPTGRCNNFAFSMGLPTRIRQACQVLANGHRRLIDIGEVVGGLYPLGRYFGNGVSIGYAAADSFLSERGKRLRARIPVIFKVLYFYRQVPRLQIELENETFTQPTLMISAMNGRRLSCGFMMAPKSQPDDGALDVCIVRQMSRIKMMRVLPRFRRGIPARDKAIILRRSQRVVVTALQGSIPALVDGETLCTEGDRLAVELHPGQIELITAR